MKSLFLSLSLALITSFSACREQSEMASAADPWDFSNFESDLNLDPHLFSRFEESATEAGIASLIDDLSVYIWEKGDKLSEKYRIFEFKVRKKGDELLVNFPIGISPKKSCSSL